MNSKRTKAFLIRLSPEEWDMFKRKASHYQSVSAMVRDAVTKFDDRTTIGKIAALDGMMALLRKYQQDLGWLGGNFNQTVKRANQLMMSNRLSQEYFDNVLQHSCSTFSSMVMRPSKSFTRVSTGNLRFW
ncbi:MAG: hypothetical protein ACOYJG_12295 [Prevotella sp.]|jgi:hypothetical protein